MFSRIPRHINPATVMALIALVFAMTGGAYAVKNHDNSSPTSPSASTSHPKTSALAALNTPLATQSKTKSKGKPGPRGPAGPKGPTGAAGATGPIGPAGAAGPAGTAGAKGETGPEGKEGKEGKAGKNGTNGTTGFTETLPPEKTETGTWAAQAGAGAALESISFTIPLAAPLENAKECGQAGKPACQVHYLKLSEKSAGCPGSAEAPSAEPGNLCVYEVGTSNAQEVSVAVEFGKLFGKEFGALTSGTFVEILPKNEAEPTFGLGSWAVTAPEA
jgi:hypothetical protein